MEESIVRGYQLPRLDRWTSVIFHFFSFQYILQSNSAYAIMPIGKIDMTLNRSTKTPNENPRVAALGFSVPYITMGLDRG